MKEFLMRFYGVDAAQAAARVPVAWFALIVLIAALMTWMWCNISYTMKMEERIDILEERVRRYRLERDIMEAQLYHERHRTSYAPTSKERAR